MGPTWTARDCRWRSGRLRGVFRSGRGHAATHVRERTHIAFQLFLVGRHRSTASELDADSAPAIGPAGALPHRSPSRSDGDCRPTENTNPRYALNRLASERHAVVN